MRIEYIDKLKGLAIILVVMGHIAEKSMGITTTPFNIFYSSFHMPLFMFLSGVFAYKSFKNWDSHEVLLFLKKKALRILLPFIVVGGVYSLVYCSKLSDVYVGINSSYWFLPALFYCMLCGLIVNCFINRVVNSSKLYWNLGIHIIFWFGLLFLYQINNNLGIPYYLHFVKMYHFFIMGNLFAKYENLKDRILTSEGLFTISVMGYILFLVYGNDIPVKLNYTGIFAIIVLTNIFVRYDKSIPVHLSMIGKYSLEIYIFHWFFLPTLNSWGNWMNVESVGLNQNFILLFGLTLILALPIIALCIFISIAIQRSRYLNFVCFGNYHIK